MKIIETQIISDLLIKPSSPTPSHLREYRLSFLDQVNPPVFMPLVLFYPSNANVSNLERSNHLRKTLSQALTPFYPLAGRLVDNLYVDCNDEGVPFVEASVNCDLAEILSDPIPDQLNKLIPYDLSDVKDLGLVIQVSYFNCGGMTVGIGISHKICDALSFFMFVNAWAAIARGETDIPEPKFEGAKLFPPRDVAGFKPSTGIVKDIVTKRFIFPNSKVVALRDKYADNNSNCNINDNNGGVDKYRRPTRVEALSTFIWTRFMASQAPDRNKIYTVNHAVNLRPRTDPPLSELHFGNISRLAIAIPTIDDRQSDGESYGVVNKVREAIRGVNGDFVKREIKEGDKHLKDIKDKAEKFMRGEVVTFNFTSLCRFPMYEADFGWGKPVWAGSASLSFKNVVVFMDTVSGDGIEAWVNMKEEDMAKFEADKELLSYVTPTTGIIIT